MKISRIVVSLYIVTCLFLLSCDGAKKEKFRAQGVETIATITEVVWKKRSNYSGHDKEKRYNHFRVTFFTRVEKPDSVRNQKVVGKDEYGNVIFNFDKLKPQIGNFVSTEIYVSSSQMKKYSKGDKVQIVYLKDDEKSAILKEDLE